MSKITDINTDTLVYEPYPREEWVEKRSELEAVLEAALATEEAAQHRYEQAVEAVEELDPLEDSFETDQRVRYEERQAEAVLAQARAAVSAAKRALDSLAGYDLAEALVPMVEKITNGHPRIPIHAVAGEADRSLFAVDAPVMIISQLAPAEREAGGKLTPSIARKWTQANAVVITHVYDRGFHRSLLDQDAVLDAARATGVALDPSGGFPDGKVYSHQLSSITHGELDSGLVFDEIKLHPVTHERIPLVETPDPATLGDMITRIVEGIARQQGTPVALGKVAIEPRNIQQDDNVRTVELRVELPVVAAQDGRSLPGLLHTAVGRLVGEVVAQAGRVIATEPGTTGLVPSAYVVVTSKTA